MANVPTKILKVAGRFGSYGEDGATFTPHISDDGENITISYTNDKWLENPAPITFKKSAMPDVTTDDNGKVMAVVDGKWIPVMVEIPEPEKELPETTAEDNGKFLQVVDGVWTAVDAVPQVTAIVNAVIEEALGGDY